MTNEAPQKIRFHLLDFFFGRFSIHLLQFLQTHSNIIIEFSILVKGFYPYIYVMCAIFNNLTIFFAIQLDNFAKKWYNKMLILMFRLNLSEIFGVFPAGGGENTEKIKIRDI